jgi:hypothetical protein
LSENNASLSRVACTQEQDEQVAARHIAEQLGPTNDLTIFVFCSSRYDLPRLSDALNQTFPGDILGCTSAGLLGPRGFQRGGMTAIGLAKSKFKVEAYLIKPLSDCASEVATLRGELHRSMPPLSAPKNTFGVLFVDGLSELEEILMQALDEQFGAVPIVGGSAGDDLRLRDTHVLYGGAFHSDAAVLSFITTDAPFHPLYVHHFVPGNRKIEITTARSKIRTIYEINGETAALAYADLVDVSMADLNPNVFSRHPLLIEQEGKHYVRSIQRVNGDGSLTLYSAIEAGKTAWIGEPRDPLTVLGDAFDALPEAIIDPSLVIGFDCVLRRLEFEQKRLDATIGRFMAAHNVIGFCTYGEQFNNLHMNQTFTGIALKTG